MPPTATGIPEGTKAIDEEAFLPPIKAANGKQMAQFTEAPGNIDDFIQPGWYFARILVASMLLCLTSLCGLMYMMFAGATPEVRGCGAMRFETTRDACAARVPANDSFAGCSSNQLVLEHQFYSVNVEFGLVCEEARAVKRSISWQMAAVLIGALVGGQLSDLYGRRITLLGSLVGLTLFTAATAAVDSFAVFVAVRIVVGFFTGVVNAVSYVYVVESIPRSTRLIVNSIVTWSPCFILFGLLAYATHDWRSLALASAAVSAATFFFVGLQRESPRFLVHHGRIDEARRLLRQMSGGKARDAQLERTLQKEKHIFETSKRRRYTFVHLFCTWTMIRWSLTICLGVTVTSLMHYGIIFNMEKMTGSLYLNTILMGAIRWMLNITVAAGDAAFACLGRKPIHFFSLLLANACLFLVVVLIYSGAAVEWAFVVRTCSIAVATLCSQMYLSKYLSSAELYPTAVRNLGSSLVNTFSRLGTTAAPMLFYLTDVHPTLPYATLLVLGLADMFAFQFCLPETKGRNLENHMPPKSQRLCFGSSRATETEVDEDDDEDEEKEKASEEALRN